MMKYFASLAVAALLGVGLAGAASATTITATDGIYLGTFDGNDDFGGQNPGFMDSPPLYKCDEVGGNPIECGADENGNIIGENYADGDFVIDFYNAFSGSWSFAPNNAETHLPHYLIIKASDKFAAFDIDGLLSGDFTIANPDYGLTPHEISHISFYNSSKPPVIPVPASAVLLLGALGGFGVLKRRRKAA